MNENQFEKQKNQAIHDLRDRGFAILNDLLPNDRLRQAQLDAEALLEPTPIDMPGTSGNVRSRMCKGLFTKSRVFDDLYVLPQVTAVLSEVLSVKSGKYTSEMWGGAIQLASTMIKDVVPSESPRAFHRDGSLYPLPIHFPTYSVNTLLALDDFREETGATLVVPYSHKWDKPIEQQPDYVSVEMPAGSMLLMDGSLWHTNGTNTTTTTHRKALNMYYTSRWLRPFGGINLGLSQTVVEELSPSLQAVLG